MNFAEFLQYCTEKEKKLWLVFEKLDLNKDGKLGLGCVYSGIPLPLTIHLPLFQGEIDSDEIKQTMKKMGVEANDSEVNKLLEKLVHPLFLTSFISSLEWTKMAIFVLVGKNGETIYYFSHTQA